ncbi:MAG: MATE family efflux transporter [Candidatus Marinimicrobia bacterium]|nr:MATE family efflux transporter [Candidatus Neomarinimicrobiota bacterium]
MALPMFFGIFGMIAFNLIDIYFIGQLGTLELAAVSFTFPVVFIIGSVALGLGIGTTTLISRAIGEGNSEQVKRITTDSLVLSVIIVGSVIGIGLISMDSVFTMMGASGEELLLIRDYMTFIYPGALFVVIPMVGNGAIRATGDMKTPAMIMGVAVLVNLILDPILIFGFGPFPRLELTGAAIATVISRAITFVVSLSVLHYREHMLAFTIPDIKEVWESWKSILYIGIATAGTQAVYPIGMGFIYRIISTYGHGAVAAFGVATRIEALALVMMMALSSAINPFIGQNLGAQKFERVKEGIIYVNRFALKWGIVAAVILALVAKPFASVLHADAEVISIVSLFLWIVPISYGLYGIMMIANSSLNVLHRPLHATAIAFIQMFVMFIPLAFIGSELIGIKGIFGASMISKTVAGIGAYYWLKRAIKNDITEKYKVSH